mgnify:CR=1 FL=1
MKKKWDLILRVNYFKDILFYILQPWKNLSHIINTIVNTIDINICARTVEENIYVNTIDINICSRTVEETYM